MVAAEVPNRREGYKAMEEKMTPARRVFRLIAAGRPPADSDPGLLEAIYTGRTTANRLFEAATNAGLDPSNVVCLLVCTEVQPMHYLRENPDLSDFEMGLNAAKRGAAPIGFAFMVNDPKAKKVLRHVRPFTRTAVADRVLNQILDIVAEGFEQEKI